MNFTNLAPALSANVNEARSNLGEKKQSPSPSFREATADSDYYPRVSYREMIATKDEHNA